MSLDVENSNSKLETIAINGKINFYPGLLIEVTNILKRSCVYLFTLNSYVSTCEELELIKRDICSKNNRLIGVVKTLF